MSDETAAVQTIDLDDPAFQEATNYDPTQDQSARLVPPELDLNKNVIEHVFKLSIGPNPKGDKKPYAAIVEKSGRKYIALVVKAQVQAEDMPYHNSFVQYPFGGVNTILFNNTTSCADICRILGKTMPANLSQQDQMAYTISLLEDDPTVNGRLEWSGYCTKCAKDIPGLTGEKGWPEKVVDGEYKGHESVTHCPTCNNEVNARANIKKWVAKKGE